jgi:hypothetical protein
LPALLAENLKENDMNTTTTIYHRDSVRERTLDVHEASRLVGAGTIGANTEWSFHKPPLLNWEREIPKYRATRNLHPSPMARHRLEPPWGMTFDSDCWQHAERPVKANEIITSKAWPHPSFYPLNYGASRVLDFFNNRTKSRLARSPWFIDRIHLEDGLSGPVAVNIPRPQQMDPRSAA